MVKRVVVLGGYGEMGHITTKDLVATAKNCEIIIAGLEAKKAKEYANSFHKKNVSGIGVDVNNHMDLVRVLRGSKVVVNAVVYRFNLNVMKAALEANCNYLDLGGLFHMTKKQLKLHKKFKQKNLIAVLGMGSTPGTTNVLAAYGSKFFNKIDEIQITFAGYDWTKYNSHFIVPYSMYTIFDEFSDKPALFTKGKLKFIEAMTGKKVFNFPKPIGKINGFYTIHSELATFPSSFKKKGVKEVSFRVTFEEDFIHDINLFIEAGLASKKIVDIKGNKIRPVDLTVKQLERLIPSGKAKVKDLEFIRVIMYGKKNNKKQTITLDSLAHSNSKWNISAGTVNTATPPSIVAQMILKDQVKKKGVLPPELCIDPKIFFSELKKRKVKILVRRGR